MEGVEGVLPLVRGLGEGAAEVPLAWGCVGVSCDCDVDVVAGGVDDDGGVPTGVFGFACEAAL